MNGILNIGKPAGKTSHDVVAAVRRILREKRVGHAGTLDPDATGVLVIAVGQGTRLLPFLPLEPKVYQAVVRFGVATDTEDAAGQITETADACALRREEIVEVLPAFFGQIAQTPPMVSAVHHQGKRLYELARAGVTVERASRPVMIHELLLTDFQPGDSGRNPEATLRVTCGGGTYIRTLAVDIGKILHLPAHLKTLMRTQVGRFAQSNAISLETLQEQGEAALLPLESALDLAVVNLDADAAEAIGHGRAILVLPETTPDTPTSGVTQVALHYRGALLAIAAVDGNRLQPIRVFGERE